MEQKELKRKRKELIEFYNCKDYKKNVAPYQKKAREISQMNDNDLEEFFTLHGNLSFITIVFNDIQNKKDDSKYKRLRSKSEDGEELTEEEVEFVEDYEESHKIEDSIL